MILVCEACTAMPPPHPDVAATTEIDPVTSPKSENSPASPDRPAADLEALVRSQRLRMAAAGHDLRQPLQVVAHAVERLGAASATPDLFWISAARTQIERLTRGLGDLALSAREAVPALAASHAFPIADLLTEISDIWASAADTKGLRLRVPRCAAVVDADRGRLATILTNLLGNAIRYTGRGGVVMGCRRRGARLRIEVVDSGAGFDVARARGLARPFMRGSAEPGGLGLGLWLVEQLCAEAAYDLAISSTPGLGSRFGVTIPLAVLPQ